MLTFHDCVARSLFGCAFLVLSIFAVVGLSFGNSYADDAIPARGYRPWSGDFDGMQKRRLIGILVPFSKTIYFIDRGEQLGTAVETGNALADELNKGRKKEIDKIPGSSMCRQVGIDFFRRWSRDSATSSPPI